MARRLKSKMLCICLWRGSSCTREDEEEEHGGVSW